MGAVAYMLAVTETIARMFSIHRYVTSNQGLRLLFLLVIAFDIGMGVLVFGGLGDILPSRFPADSQQAAPTVDASAGDFAGAFVGIGFTILHLIVRLASMCMFAASPPSTAVSRAPPLSVMPPKQQQEIPTRVAPAPAPTSSSVGELKHMDSARSDVNDSGIFSTLTSSDEINPAELHDMVEFGKGSFGIVYRATYRHSEVAVKSINENAFGDDTDIVTEARTLSALPTHANVVAFRGFCRLKSGRPAIVLEFCEGGSLLTALRNTAVEWTLEKQIKVASGTAAGVAHLHKCGIVHRDIAARNVLLASLDSMIPKVTDFGMSKAEAEADSTLSSFGSAAWMAPEQLQSTRADGKFTFSMASDVFAFGVLLFEIFERKTPWSGFQLVDIRDRVSKGKRVEFDATKYPADVLDLMDNCWNFLPAHRPAMDTIATSLAAKRKGAASSATTKRKSKAVTEPLQRDEYDDSAPGGLPLPQLPATPLERDEYDQNAPTL
jgi:predicted Ser/Thr protein kinase